MQCHTPVFHSRLQKILLTTTLLFCALLLPSPVQAENMTSPTYRLFFGNFNVTSGSKSGTLYRLTDTVGQLAPGQFGLAGYIIKSGFQYLYPLETFSFKVSRLAVDLGSLAIGSFSSADQYLEVTSVGAGGYSVYAYEDHPMLLTSGSATIPDTLCDTTCSETTAAIWINPSKDGFGYTMSGDDVPAAFVDTTYFKQFADLSAPESPQVVMGTSGVGTKRSAKVTYKISIDALQQAGTYQTQIVYIAVPGF